MNPENDGRESLQEPLTKRQFRQWVFTATLTALAAGLIMSATIILFTLFCVFVWLK